MTKKKEQFKWIKSGSILPRVAICELGPKGVRYRLPTFNELLQKTEEQRKSILQLDSRDVQQKRDLIYRDTEIKQLRNRIEELVAALGKKQQSDAARLELAKIISNALNSIAQICGETGLLR